MRVYLAGPINGCTDDEANTWRDIAKSALGKENCIDPMRRDYRGREDECLDEIVILDKLDIVDSDVVLANCWQFSVGTSMEVLFASERGKSVIAVVKPGATVSPWLRFHALAVVDDLDRALTLIKGSARLP